MNNSKAISQLFTIAALYDFIIGAGFLLLPEVIFSAFDVTPPNHPGYVQFPAALLMIFGLMFWRIAKNPQVYRHMIPYGIMLKIAYCGVVFGNWAMAGLPDLWKPFAFADLAFLVLFLSAFRATAPKPN